MQPSFTPPEFIDNREQRMSEAIIAYLGYLKATLKEPPQISIATGYFNPAGFAAISPGLTGCCRVRLLLGAEPTVPLLHQRRAPGDPKGPRWQARLVSKALGETDAAMHADRDLIPFLPEEDAAVRGLLYFLSTQPIEVRRYERGFLHGKAYLFGNRNGIFAGSSNLTIAGLKSNLELNLGSYQPSQVGKVAEWFERLWEEASPYDLAAIYQARYAEYDPYLIYLRVLWERYRNELEIEASDLGRIRLTTFQRDGLDRARRVLDRYGGVLVADGVGLGKSFIAGELMRHAVEEDNRRVLLVSPAALRDGTWDRFLTAHQLGVENISYEQLAADKQLGGGGAHLRRDIKEYDIVVIDEAQAFRNPDALRAQALRFLLQGKPRKRLVLLTATPVNNSLWDLFTLFRYFLGHDGVLAHLGIPSLREKFKHAAAIDPYDLSPDALFDVIDEVTVRRTRQFVKRFYPNERIRTPGGVEVTIRFPRPHVSAETYLLNELLPGFFDELAEAMAPAGHQEPLLSMARYNPSRFHHAKEVRVSELALVGLVRSALLKRFESSIHAFRETLRRMIESHEKFLKALDHGFVAIMQDLDEWSLGDSDEELARILAEGGSQPAADYDVTALRAAVQADMETLRRFHGRVKAIEPREDPKLARLEELLARIVRQAEHECYGEEDFRNKRKVIVFSYYEDTLRWIEEYLAKALKHNKELRPYHDRMVSVSGSERLGDVGRQRAIFGFVPVSSEAPPGTEDRYDIMLTTDVLAEGMNLQQCRNVINYDLPWNPMRLVQRHGRIDRIGSPHEDVYIRCFFPDERLEEMLALEDRIRRKLAQAAATIGIESEVVPGGAVNAQNFADTRDQIAALREEDPRLFETEGRDPAALSGEEYRQELRRALQTREREIRGLPACAGSGFAGGRESGIFFCARAGERVFLRFVKDGATIADADRRWGSREDPHAGGRQAIGRIDDPLAGDLPGDRGHDSSSTSDLATDRIVHETLTCLKFIHCDEHTPRALVNGDYSLAYAAWCVARHDIWLDWQRFTDPANLLPKVERFFRQMADHVRRFPAALSQDEQTRLIETLEAPWDVRTRRAFQGFFDPDSPDPNAMTQRIQATVRERGMQPFQMPEPSPPIEEDEIQLVCWMAVRR